MSDPQSRLGEARKQIRLATEHLETLSVTEELDEDVVADLEEAAALVESVQERLVDLEDDQPTGP